MTLPVPGYASTLNVGGTSTATTGEGTSAYSGAGDSTVRQITTAAKRAIDPAVAVVVKDGVGTVAAASYIIDYMYGLIRFQSYTPSGTITADFSYIPLLAVAGVRGITAEFGRAEIDTTVISNGVLGGEDALLGKKMGSGEIEFIRNESDDQDPGAGTQTFLTYLQTGVSFLLDVQVGLSASPGGGFRAWCKLSRIGRDGINKGDEVIGKKFRWKACNGADDPSKDAWFSCVEAFT